MWWTRPIPVTRDKIIVGELYYTCSYTGVVNVIVLKIFDDTNCVLVKINNKKPKFKPFVRSMDFIFDNREMAKSAGREWEHSERKRAKERKNKEKAKREKSL
jgi:hypothetical protein